MFRVMAVPQNIPTSSMEGQKKFQGGGGEGGESKRHSVEEMSGAKLEFLEGWWGSNPPKKHPWGKEGINSLLYSRSDTGLVPCNNFILVLYKHQVKIYVVVQIFLCLKIFKPV